MGDLLQTIVEAFKAEAVAWIVWTALTALTTWCFSSGRQRLKRWWWLRQLGRATKSEVVALVVRVGGRGDPLPDVQKYVRKHLEGVEHVLSYATPDGADLATPDFALRVVEDLFDSVAKYGQGELRELHLFYAGMVAYPFALGALLGNWVPVTVYHSVGSDYVPLYRIDKQQLHRPRLSAPLAQLKVVPLKSTGAAVAAGADASAAPLALEEGSAPPRRIEPPADDAPTSDTVDA